MSKNRFMAPALLFVLLCFACPGQAADRLQYTLGSATTEGAIELEVGKHILVKKIPVQSAKTVHGVQAAPIDGSMNSRDFQGKPAEYPAQRDRGDCGGLHLTFLDDLGIDAVLFRGTAAGVAYQDATSQKTAAPENKLFDFSMRQSHVFRKIFDERVYPQTLDIFHNGPCASPQSGTLADLSFYRIDRRAPWPQIGFYGLQGFAKPSPLVKKALAERFGPKQMVESLVYGTKGSAFLSVKGRGFVHMLIDDLPTDKAVDKITFLLGFKTVDAPALLTIRIHDPLDPMRDIMSADFLIRSKGVYMFTLDTPDIILLPKELPKDASSPTDALTALPPALWISVGANKTIAVKRPRVGLSYLPLEAAEEEAHLWRTHVLQSFALPKPSPGAARPRVTDAALRAIDVAHILDPENEMFKNYRRWAFPAQGLNKERRK